MSNTNENANTEDTSHNRLTEKDHGNVDMEKFIDFLNGLKDSMQGTIAVLQSETEKLKTKVESFANDIKEGFNDFIEEVAENTESLKNPQMQMGDAEKNAEPIGIGDNVTFDLKASLGDVEIPEKDGTQHQNETSKGGFISKEKYDDIHKMAENKDVQDPIIKAANDKNAKPEKSGVLSKLKGVGVAVAQGIVNYAEDGLSQENSQPNAALKSEKER